MEDKLSREQAAKRWHFYNYCMLSDAFPHETVDVTKVKNGQLWKENKKALFARWVSDFDCEETTSWWYVITKEPFDISKLKAKRRYIVVKGRDNFDVRRIDPKDYVDELYQVYTDSMEGYAVEHRRNRSYEDFERSMLGLSADAQIQYVYAAFFRETNELCGYVHVPVHKEWAALSALKTKPRFEKFQINAALVYYVLEDLKDRMDGNYYIADGERNILHQTRFQDYLEKYFMFRKAYCHLNIQYRPIFKPLVYILYPFRKMLKKADKNAFIHKINGVLLMEEIRRSKN